MAKIRDRIYLGIVAGTIGTIAKIAVDEASTALGISQRSFRATAAGVWVSTKKEANTPLGQLLGTFLDLGMGMLGGVGTVALLTSTGRDKLLPKGILSGIALGSAITVSLNAFTNSRLKPKDAASNVSYMMSHAVYGLVTTVAASALGDSSLFIERQPFAAAKRFVTNTAK